MNGEDVEPVACDVDPEPLHSESRGRRRPVRAVLGALLGVALVGGGFVLGATTGADDRVTDGVVTPRAAGDASGSGSSEALVTSDPSGSSSGGGVTVLQRVFVRGTGDGIELRAYLQSSNVQTPQCAPGTWCPGPDCFPTVFFQVEASNTNAVGTWATPADGSPTGPLQVTDLESLGSAEGDPATVVAVRTSDQVANVTLTIGDHTDSMAPIDGWAALAVPSSTSSGLIVGTITGYGNDGAQLAQVSTSDPRSSFVSGADCQPPPPSPPALPEADGPPPVDQDAAKAAIEDAYHQVFGAASLDLIEDGDQLQATVDEAAAKNPVPPGIGSTVHEIRFINDHRAALIWDLVDNGNPLLANQIGFAVLVDGTWKVARETDCALLKLGGATCP